MTTYRKIHGRSIQAVTTDPTESVAEGQVWYNTNSDTFKSVVSSEAWSSSTPLITPRSQVAGAGTKTAALAMGGSPSSSSAPSRTNGNLVEEYNGLGWTSEATSPLYKRGGSSFGTQTAAVFFGGYDDPQGYEATTTEYNGSSWTSGGSYPSDISNKGGGAGILTAAYSAGGYSGTAYMNATKEYDGSSWSDGGNLPWAGSNVNNIGTLTAGLAVGGGGPITNNVATYDGTNWTVATSAPVPLVGNGNAGIQTDALVYGGLLPSAHSTATIKWDGSSWTTSSATLAQGRNNGAGCGVSPASPDAFFVGGDVSESTVYGNMEEYNKSVNVITSAAWASGGALSTGRESMSSAGTQTAALAVGGRVGPPGASTAVESYNGTSMSGAPSLNTARQYAGGCGTQTAAITYANNPVSGATEEYNGSSWATQPNSMSTARRSFASFGIQTAALAAGGTTGPAVSSLTEEYNGTSWTAGGALSQARQYYAGAGIETSGLVFGGSDNPNSTKYTNTEEYGGSSWTAGGALPTGTSGLMGCGATQTAALAFGGYQPSKVATTVGYDGTAWSTRPSMGGATAEGSGAGTNIAALSIGGSPAETGVEEFTGDTTALNVKTLTQS